MRQKSNSTPVCRPRTLSATFGGQRGSTMRPKRRSASCSTACAAKLRSPSFSGGRTSPESLCIQRDMNSITTHLAATRAVLSESCTAVKLLAAIAIVCLALLVAHL